MYVFRICGVNLINGVPRGMQGMCEVGRPCFMIIGDEGLASDPIYLAPLPGFLKEEVCFHTRRPCGAADDLIDDEMEAHDPATCR